MGRPIFSFLLFLVFSTTGFGFPTLKGSLGGRVTDAATGMPIPGVSILIADLRVGTNTDKDGLFMISNIVEGFHLVEVSHIGYNTTASNILIEGDVTRNFALTVAIVENNEVIVTGVTRATQLKKMPFQVSVMRKEELTRSATTNIIEALTKKPGVTSISTGQAIAKPMIRGLGYNRVLTLNDGVRQEGQQWGDEHGIEIDEASVNKIEVLKGPASLVYGSDAMAGVINIISNVPVQENTMKVNVGTNLQSNNRLRAVHANWSGRKQGFNWNAYISRKAAADYKNKYDGPVFNSKFNEQNAGGYAGFNGNWGFSHLLISNFNLHAGLVEGERDMNGFFIKPLPGGTDTIATTKDFNSTDPQVPFQHIRHFKIASDNNFKFGKHRLTLNVGWQRNQRQEFGNVDDLSEKALYFDLETSTYSTQFHFREAKGWKPSIGVNGMIQKNTNKGIEQLIPDYSMNDLGIFLYSQKELKKLDVSGGVRYDRRTMNVHQLLDAGSVKSEGFKREFGNFSASMGAAYELTKNINIKLNVARAFRAPSIPELASNGAHEGTIRYEYGDKRLKSETSLQTDAGVEFANEHFSLNLSGFFNQFNNFIFYKKLASAWGGDSLIEVNGSQLQAFQFDQRKASLAGFEVSLDIHPHPLDWLHIQNTFSLVRGRFYSAIEGNKNLPYIPAARLLSEARADFKKVGRFANLYVKIEMDNNLEQSYAFRAYNTETNTPAYTLFNAGTGADISTRKGIALFSLNFIVVNLTDVAYQNHLSRLKYAAINPATNRQGVFNAGRNFSVRMNIPLQFKLSK